MGDSVALYWAKLLDFLGDPAVAALIALVGVLLAWKALPNSRQQASADRSKSKDTPSKLTVASWDDVVGWGWDGERLLRELVDLDYLTTPLLDDATEGSPKQWAPVFSNHPDTWRLLVHGDKNIVAYWGKYALYKVTPWPIFAS